MRNGVWALYLGKEYEVIEHSNNNYELFTTNSGTSSLGFALDSTGHYCKHVTKKEIQSAYDVRYYARYRALEFPVFQEEVDKLLLGSGTHGPDIIKKYGFVEVDRFEYEKWVEKSNVVKFYEVKVPMWGFPAP